MATHPILDFYANRRTIRDYKQEPLAEGDLERIIAAGQRAPTGALGQIYSVIRVARPELCEKIAALSGHPTHIRDAAEFLVFCLDVRRNEQLLAQQGSQYDVGPRIAVHYGTMDTLLMAANVATAAEALGYGTCFIGNVLNYLDALARELQLPTGVLPLVGLTIGVPAEQASPPRTPRLPQKLILHQDTYHDPTPADLDAAFEAMGDQWAETLQRFFGPDGAFAQREEIWERTLEQQGFGS